MRLPLYIVNAFTDRPFAGNPAAVCPVESWPADDLMQAIAAENDLSETAFYAPEPGGRFRLRWFAPSGEVDLCGHATLATGHVLFHERGQTGDAATFTTRSGRLTVRRNGDRLHLDFPRVPTTPETPPADLAAGLGEAIADAFVGMDHVAVLPDEAAVRRVLPRLDVLSRLDRRGVVVTAPSATPDADYVCRCFAPKFGIAEDPVTGSVQCMLAPYWAGRLGKRSLRVRQLSARGGEMTVSLAGDRVDIAGQARLYARGELTV